MSSATIDSLALDITSNSQGAVNGLDSLITTLGSLKEATKGGLGLRAVATQVSSVGEASKTINGSAVNNLTGLFNAIKLLGGVKVSSTIGKQITSISSSLNSFNIGDGAAKMRDLVSALSPLSELPKNNLGSTVTQLKRLPTVLTELSKIDMRQFYNTISQVTRILKPLATEMEKVSNGFSAFPTKIQKLVAGNQKLENSNNMASMSFANLYAKIKLGITSVIRLGRVISKAINTSNDYIEDFNLFTVAMGEFADAAKKYADKVSDLMGIDPAEWMRNQGVFMTLATGFGVVGDRAYIMSKNLTQLGYDISSFFNLSFEESMKKLESGLAGELEPLRRIGYDLSVARLQQEAYTLGIKKKVSAMTQAEKAELRYYAIMTQVTTVQGDMARTLENPANQLKILKAQFTQVARAIGNIFIPALNAILPYAIAIAKVIHVLADAIATLFGFKLPEVDYSGVGMVGDVADKTADSLGDAANNAKKLKNYMMGFDELNVIDPTSGNGGGNGVDGIGGNGLGFELPEYDFLKGVTEGKVAQIVDKMKEWLGITGEIDSWSDLFNTRLGNILITVGIIGSSLLAWKFGSNLLTNLPNVVKGFKALKSSAKLFKGAKLAGGLALTISSLAIDFVAIKNAIKNGLDGFNFTEILGASGGLIGGGALIGSAFGNAILGGAIAAIPAGLAAFFTGIYDACQNGLNWLNGILIPLGSTMAGAGIGAIIGSAAGPLGAGIGLLVGLAVDGAMALVTAVADIPKTTDIFKDGISELTEKKVKPFIDEIQELDTVVTSLDWSNTAITNDDVADITNRVRSIANTIINELDSDKNESLANLEPLRNALGEKAYNELISDNEKYYADLTQKVTDGEARIYEIMSKAADENRALTDEESREITRIKDDMLDTGVKHLSESEVEYTTIMRRLKDNSVAMSLEQASEIIQNAMKTRDDTIAAAEEQYSKQILEAERMKEAGIINQSEYDKIVSAAETTRDDAIAAANTQYDTVYNTATTKLGDTAKYINKETGGIKSTWSVFCDNIAKEWKDGWTNAENNFNDIKKRWSQSYKDMIDTFRTKLGDFKQSIKDWWSDVKTWWTNHVNFPNVKMPHFSWDSKNSKSATGIMKTALEALNLPTSIPTLKVDWYASGGFPNVGEMFVARERGPEMVGSIGRKTAVVNNEQIVTGIASGVAEANSEQNSLLREQNSLLRAILEKDNGWSLDGKTITQSVEKYQRERGIQLITGGVV